MEQYAALDDYLKKCAPYVKLVVHTYPELVTVVLWGLDDDLQQRDEIVRVPAATLHEALVLLSKYLSEYFKR